MIDIYKERIETIEKELAAIKADIVEIVKPDTLRVGWVYEDRHDNKWIVYNYDDAPSMSSMRYLAVCFGDNHQSRFDKNGHYSLNSTDYPTFYDLILSTLRKLEL